MSAKSKTKRSKKRRKNNLAADVVMRLFLHETSVIRNLTKRIQELDQQLTREFASFNQLANLSSERIAKYVTYCLNRCFGRNGLRKSDLNSSLI